MTHDEAIKRVNIAADLVRRKIWCSRDVGDPGVRFDRDEAQSVLDVLILLRGSGVSSMRKDDQGAALLLGDPISGVTTEALPNIGDTVKYDWMGAIWTDEVVAIDRKTKRFWVKGNGLPMRVSALVTR